MAFDRNTYSAQWREEHRDELREYQREYMRKRRAANPEKAKLENRENSKRRRARDPDHARQKDREFYHSQTPERKRERAAKHRISSREAIRATAKRWAKRNPEKKNAATAQRRAARLRAMPPWVDRAALREVYAERLRIQRETATKHHVDHIVPLQGKNVCGLHVPWNLQILLAVDNFKKSNKLAA